MQTDGSLYLFMLTTCITIHHNSIRSHVAQYKYGMNNSNVLVFGIEFFHITKPAPTSGGYLQLKVRPLWAGFVTPLEGSL